MLQGALRRLSNASVGTQTPKRLATWSRPSPPTLQASEAQWARELEYILTFPATRHLHGHCTSGAPPGCSAPPREFQERRGVCVVGGAEWGPQNQEGSASNWEPRGGEIRLQTPPLTTQPHSFPSHPPPAPQRSPGREKVGGGSPETNRAHAAAPHPPPRPSSWVPPPKPPARPGPGSHPGRAPRRLPGRPLPSATGSGSSRAARPASSGSGSGGSPDRPMLRLSAIGGHAAPCRARPASGRGGGRREEGRRGRPGRGGSRGRGPAGEAGLEPEPPRPARGGLRQRRGVAGAAPGPPRSFHGRRRCRRRR